MEGNQNSFKHLIRETDEFVVTCEHVPGRVSHHKKLDEIITFAEKCKETGIVHAISLTDNPSGSPAISPDILALEIEKVGLPAIVHFTCKDMNRNMMESRALSLDRMGVRNLLIMSGDFQTMGQSGLPMPVFDADPVHIVTILSLMNKGWRIKSDSNSLEEGPKTDFFHGSVVSPYKFTEAEVFPQMYKMEMKARAGSNYFVTQLGFDAAKLKDLMNYMKENDITVPMLGSVFILRKGAAGAMHRGDIPGSFVTDDFLSIIRNEAKAEDKGRAASLERAAMQVAVLKGLGFRGAHIEAMILRFNMVETILGRAEELKDSWEECAEKLNFSPEGSFLLGNSNAFARSKASRKLKSGWIKYRITRIIHDLFFVKEGFLGVMMRKISKILDSLKPVGAISHFGERAAKVMLFDCRDCGDCALPELQFLCPQSQCPKQQRNGPCGGSRLDACEVYPDIPCVWTKVYTRAKAFGELESVRKTVIGPLNWDLRETSGWVNFHLNYDHTGYDFSSYFDTPEREEIVTD